MRFVIFFLFVFLIAGLFGTLIFLNLQPVELVLTPVIGGIYYHLPTMPLGLLVVLSLVIGFLLGYIFNWILK